MWSKLIGSSTKRLLLSSFKYFAQGKTNRDLYETLGISKSASQGDIKKAYYKLAQQYHPDKNTSPDAKDKFAQINNAYETLSDTNKRQMYDQTGSTDNNFGDGQGFPGGFGGFGGKTGGFEDLFRDIFGGGNNQEQFGGQPTAMQMQISFEQSVNGASKDVQFTKQVQCTPCKGSGAKQGTSPITCNKCQGTGFKTIQQGMMIMRTNCDSCRGQGKIIKQHCGTCKGSGKKSTIAKQTINIPRGIDNNTNLRLKAKGNMGNDLIIMISVRKSPKFKRQGVNVWNQLDVPVIDLILGSEKQVDTIYGRKATLKIPQGTQVNAKLKIPLEGFYHPNTKLKGDHYIIIKAKIPTSLSSSQKQMYEQIRKNCK